MLYYIHFMILKVIIYVFDVIYVIYEAIEDAISKNCFFRCSKWILQLHV